MLMIMVIVKANVRFLLVIEYS